MAQRIREIANKIGLLERNWAKKLGGASISAIKCPEEGNRKLVGGRFHSLDPASILAFFYHPKKESWPSFIFSHFSPSHCCHRRSSPGLLPRCQNLSHPTKWQKSPHYLALLSVLPLYPVLSATPWHMVSGQFSRGRPLPVYQPWVGGAAPCGVFLCDAFMHLLMYPWLGLLASINWSLL